MTIDTATGLEAPAELSSERVRDIFSHIARKYERFNALSSFGAYKLWLAGMMRQAPIDESHDVLDIAGGTGDVTFTVARTKHPSHIQCTDLVPEMLDVARMHIDEGDGAGVPIDFEVVDAQDIPYADASYDVITMAYGIRNMPERDRALAEMFRVLKPGGYLLRAYPLREHLWELKALIYDTPRDNPPTPLETEGFTLVETREVRDIIHLPCTEDILALFRMTPYYYKTGVKDQQKAEQAKELAVQLAFGLAIYQKN